MNKTIIIALVALSLTISCQQANNPALGEASPESAGICPERLARLDRMCEEAVANGNIPGIVTLVARNGKIVYWKAFGMADNETGRTLKRDDIFRIASQTKAVTATAVMMLWEEGKFRLDDPISKYIPEFKNPQVLASFNRNDSSYTTIPANSEITIRQLLTHTSGIGYGQIDSDERFRMIHNKAGIIDLFTAEDVSVGENIRKLAGLPLHHHPGERYTYGEGLDVLGYFIEVVSGMPFDRFLRERLFDPLGMHDTWFYLPEEKAGRLVPIQHKTADGTWERYPVTYYDPEFPVKGARRYFSGGAGLSSTARDYATFLQMYLNGGEFNGTRILSRTTIQAIMGNQTGDLFGGNSGIHHGLAFGVVNEEGQALGGQGSAGSFFWGGYFNTQGFADPQENLIGIIMKQTRGNVTDDTGWMYRILTGQAIDD
jgi:CubicO group peptidase (beta-lactamase class C family)